MALRCCDVEAQGLPTRDCSMREGEVCAIMGILASVSPGTDLENLEVAAHPHFHFSTFRAGLCSSLLSSSSSVSQYLAPATV
eukprot:CAMPEP_0174359908 /NCGR_PEP_ID=MMETSP0811_2-20130205/51164_1 /TAXON_ID=73025 ORGANISM="Eutreptiella gymnastica-like, Strain CCMP1594" /NCGR_SAMPLE_ID=MMETSP0811_2 /ASSEMBLY_ACC=CAM_ASM_000667 /LENGTH=81 /DNA_ID=CAMNT_0015495063 /DNA_START=19 /DNA_END=265 /DNA_ORIENTATION=+